MKIVREGKEIELTNDEIYHAYCEHFHNMCLADVDGFLETRAGNYPDMDTSLINEDLIDGLADIMEEAHEEIADEISSDVFEAFEARLDNYGIDLNDMISVREYFDGQDIGELKEDEPEYEFSYGELIELRAEWSDYKEANGIADGIEDVASIEAFAESIKDVYPSPSEQKAIINTIQIEEECLAEEKSNIDGPELDDVLADADEIASSQDYDKNEVSNDEPEL